MLRAGEWVGRYELVRVLGQGGMGQVWLARAQEIAGTRRSAALKFFPFDESGDDLDVFMGEARIAMLLTHSNVVQVFDAGECESGRFLVMEWVDGIDLGKILREQWRAKERIELGTAMFIVAQVLRALHYAHGLRQDGRPLHIVHRDVSPQNVMVSVSGEVKLADFGIARSAIHSTAGTHVKGKLRYMPPEQLDGVATHSADLFAVGAIMHELVSHGPFRRGRGVAELCAEIAVAEIPALDEPLPEELERVRQRLLAADPGQRFASAEEALRTLQKWSEFRDQTFAVAELCERYMPAAPVATLPQTDAVPTKRGETDQRVVAIDERRDSVPARRRGSIVVAAGLVVAAAMGVAWWQPWRSEDAPRDAIATAGPAATVAEPKVEETKSVPPEAANVDSAKVEEPEPTPVAAEVDAPEPMPEEKQVDAEPEVDGAKSPRGSGRRRTKAKSTTATPAVRSDADVLAGVRASAKRACAEPQGASRVAIDFLIEADGRPALLKSSSPGDPRSACVEKKLRSARFTEGSSRRASLSVSFD